MVAFGIDDLWWVFVAAIVAGLGGLFVVGIRVGVATTLRKARAGFIGWFRDAVDEHVEPKFAQAREEAEAHDRNLRAKTSQIAAEVEAQRVETAARLEEATARIAAGVQTQLAEHIESEEGAIRTTVAAVIGPLAEKVEGHIAADQEAFQRNDDAHASTAEAIARIEAKLEES